MAGGRPFPKLAIASLSVLALLTLAVAIRSAMDLERVDEAFLVFDAEGTRTYLRFQFMHAAAVFICAAVSLGLTVSRHFDVGWLVAALPALVTLPMFMFGFVYELIIIALATFAAQRIRHAALQAKMTGI